MEWRFGGHRWQFVPGQRPRIMGIVNATPDSFSDGGRFASADEAVAHGLALASAGADLLDVGGESTRPGALATSSEVEIGRVVPVILSLSRGSTLVSVDTSKAAVAERALASGACIVNDVSALRDAGMGPLVAESRAGLILMHMRGTPETMQVGDLESLDIVGDVCRFLEARLAQAVRAGVDESAVALDPGIGFGKTLAQNLALLAGVDRLRALGRPIVIGLSRKSFLGAITGRDVGAREAATASAHAITMLWGVDVLRVHDVAATLDALAVAQAFADARAQARSEAA